MDLMPFTPGSRMSRWETMEQIPINEKSSLYITGTISAPHESYSELTYND